jgi:hypothetical protein
MARRSWRYHAHRLVFRHLGIPPGTMRPYALPGAARLHELRWRRRLARAPVTDYASHAAAQGVGEIEEPIPCSLCGGERVRALFRTKGYAVVRWRTIWWRQASHRSPPARSGGCGARWPTATAAR